MERLLERARDHIMRLTSPVIPEEERVQSLKEFSKLLEDAHREKRPEIFRSLVEELSKKPDTVSELVAFFWRRKDEALNRGTGKFFKELFRRLKNQPHVKRSVLVMSALLALAANHDIPSIKRLHPLVPHAVEGALSRVKDRKRFHSLLGRQHLRRLLRYGELLRNYLESSRTEDPETIRYLVPKIDLEELERLSRSRGRTIPWVELWIDKIVEKIDATEGLQKGLFRSVDLHPEDKKKAIFFFVHHRDRIDPQIAKAEGDEFIRYKVGEYFGFVKELERELNRLNGELEGHELFIPKNVVEHLAAQTIPESCASWPEFIIGILHGPSIPVVIRDKSSRKILGRIFFTFARGRDGRAYVVHGDYEGRKEGEATARRVIETVNGLARSFFGTEVIGSNKLNKMKELGLRAPHEQPWVPRD